MIDSVSEPVTEAPASDFRRVVVILNPVSGVNQTANEEIRAYLAAMPERDIKIHETHEKGDATRFASEAARDGVDIVLAYGGDGTMAEAAAGLCETNVPLGMLPGGTANVMAVELGIPLALNAALDLIFRQPNQRRVVDMGVIDRQPFLLRAGIGYEAESTATAPRSEKRHSGRLAYFRHALQKLRNIRPARYVITVDGETVVTRGITCLICNSASIGVPGLRLTRESDVGDGMLDVIVVNGSLMSLIRMVGAIVRSILPRPGQVSENHWQGRNITVEIQPQQAVAYDGEMLKKAKRVSASVLPSALNVIVPA